MSTVQLENIDPAPVRAGEFNSEFFSWLCVLVDSLNYTITQLQAAITQTNTTTEITTISPGFANGTLFYDSTTNQLKAKVNGVIVVLA